MDIIIRQETPGDYGSVYELVKESFALAEHSGGNEQELVGRLRAGKNFIPELSLVAVENGAVVGHLMFTKMPFGNGEILITAPLSVAPSRQSRGIGRKLMDEGLRIAAKLGYGAVHLVGHPLYYPRFGYIPGSEFGIKPAAGIPEEASMFKELFPKALKGLSGKLLYPAEFGITPD